MSKLALQHVISGTPDSKPAASYRRFALSLAAFTALPLVALAAFIMAVDPYYVFGSPSWHGINVVRPHYENRVVISKPYQVARLHPSAVALGSSRVEVGIDPRHPGWGTSDAFNFALPSSNSYVVMLAFLHAQAHGRPLKRAVVGLDFFAFNIKFTLTPTLAEQRFAAGATDEFIKFLDEESPGVLRANTTAPRRDVSDTDWDEALYLAVNGDVANAIASKQFTSGRQHFEFAGRAEGRLGGTIPNEWDEAGYLQAHQDVKAAVGEHRFLSGYHHYLAAGRAEGRLGGFVPPDWNEAQYLALNPDIRLRIALGFFRTGFVHYAAFGRADGRLGGFPPTSYFDRLSVAWPSLNRLRFIADDLFRMVFSTSAISDAMSTLARQSEPAVFDDAGMRVWHGHEPELRQAGGAGGRFDELLRDPSSSPTHVVCFSNPTNGMSLFAPYRFMLRKAYAEGTDLRLFVTPHHAATLEVRGATGLDERYEFWLRELVRINEQEAARAGQEPLPLWDFSDVNAITREVVPAADDPSPMRWFWEQSHYRQATGDLILDRIFGHSDPERLLPEDFGVRLTGANIERHFARGREEQKRWSTDNAALSERIARAAQNETHNRQAGANCR
jgi:hypothetical protein